MLFEEDIKKLWCLSTSRPCLPLHYRCSLLVPPNYRQKTHRLVPITQSNIDYRERDTALHSSSYSSAFNGPSAHTMYYLYGNELPSLSLMLMYT